MPKLIIEFSQADDQRKKASWCDRNIESDSYVPIPAVGDTVNALALGAKKILKVERRYFGYQDDWTHVQLFCIEVEESEI